MGGNDGEPNHREGMTDEIIDTVLSTVDMQEVLERTGGILRRHFGETRVSIHRLVDPEPDLIEIVYVYDPKVPQEGVGRRVPIAGSVCGEAVTKRQTVVAVDLGGSLERYHEARFLAPLGYQALAAIPLIVEDVVLGTLDLAQGPDSGLLGSRLADAEQVARLLAIALNNSLMVDEVRRLNRLLDRENTTLKREIHRTRKDQRYIASSPIMREVMRNVELVAPEDMTVLIRGETGTGKEGLARALHERSLRRAGPFVVVNLAAIPESLIESELFGHEKGAFTGAASRREGFFETAAGGTLFLDEVGDASLPLQVRLMRALQEHEITRVGSSVAIPVDVRVVAATNRPLEDMVRHGTFRSDLYYRLNIFPITLPPLRERPGDVRRLAGHFLRRQGAAADKLTEAALEALERHPFPGNVRELENTLERAMILAGSDPIGLEHVGVARPDRAGTGGQAGTPGWVPEIPAEGLSLEVLERELILKALERARGNKSQAARLLGLTRRTLYSRMERHGLRRPGEGDAAPENDDDAPPGAGEERS